MIISLLILIILVSGISGCAPSPAPKNQSNATAPQKPLTPSQVQSSFSAQMKNITFNSQYTAQHYSNYSSSDGIRILNITYTIKNKTLVYCTGVFTSIMKTRPNDNIICDIVTLKNEGYNAGPNYFTQENISERIKDFQPTQFSKEDGKSCYIAALNKVCFENNKIVTYVWRGNPDWDWNIIG